MLVKFENGSVPIWKLKQGVVVNQEFQHYHIQSFYWDHNNEFILVLENYYEVDFHVRPEEVTWLEPF